MEILSPAGSFDAIVAAVFGGADAVYFGSANFNARQNAQNLTHEQIAEGIKFCKTRGVKTNATLNTLIGDKEFTSVIQEAEFFANAGIDAFIVQDLGFAQTLKSLTNIPLHASTQMAGHNLDGVLALEKDFARVVLARELCKEDIEYITAHSAAQIEVFAHGALCMSYSGCCYMSSVIGARSGNRGMCAQPCRLPYNGEYKLSLKDLCLLDKVQELKQSGVSSLKIEGRMKSPEYVYSVTRAYADAKNGKPYKVEDEISLSEIFSRNGFTKGYYEGKPGKSMFGIHEQKAKSVNVEKKEYKRLWISFKVEQHKNTLRFSAQTQDGFAAESYLDLEKANNTPTTKSVIETSLSKLGDTVYFLKNIKFDYSEELFVPLSSLNSVRRELISKIESMRLLNTNMFREYNDNFTPLKKPKSTLFEGQFLTLESIPENANLLSKIWLPLTLINTRKIDSLLEKYENVGLYTPSIIEDHEYGEYKKLLKTAKEKNIKMMLCGNIGSVARCLEEEFDVYGDYGLNVFNTKSVKSYFDMGVKGLTLSFELNIAALKDICDENCGIIAYGRLPFMIMRNCIKEKCYKNEFLIDRIGKKFLLSCDFGCRNKIYNSDILFLADKVLPPFGFNRLFFTDETSEEAKSIVNAYICGKTEAKKGITRGLYYKKV